MNNGPNEAEIVQGLRRGDRDAWDALCRQYSGRVWRYVARLVGRSNEAVADVYQETMLAVATAGRGITEDTKLWAWLAGIGHNQAALYWRKRYRDADANLETALLTDGTDNAPLEALTQLETVEAVRCLLAEMNSDHVAVLTAKYLDGLSVSGIVDSIGGTTESIRSRLARARKEFRQRYETLSKEENDVTGSALPNMSPGKGNSS